MSRDRAADLVRKEQNTRLILIVVAGAVLTAVVLFVDARGSRLNDENTQINRDGIACMLEMLDEHRGRDVPPGEVLSTPPTGLPGSCTRFFEVRPPSSSP